MVPFAPFLVELPHREALEQDLGVDQARVDPEQQIGIEGIVAQSGDLVDPVDVLVHPIDPLDGLQGFLGGPERHRVSEPEGPVEALPWVALV